MNSAQQRSDNMLPFFPTPYPDELLYSVFARYHVWSRNYSYQDTLNDLYGLGTRITAVIDFPHKLQNVCEQLTPESMLTPDHLIQHHTLFPLYRPFLPEERASKIAQAMKGGEMEQTGSIHMSIGTICSTIPMLSFLRYCNACVSEDKEKYGELYWHRSHQVPGLMVCPIHRTPLHLSNVSYRSRQNKYAFFPLTENVVNNPRNSEFLPVHEHAYVMAEEVHWLLCNEIHPFGLDNIKAYYLDKLKSQKFASYSGQVSSRDLMNAFFSHYGKDYLEQVHSSFNINSNENWLTCMWRKPRNATNPIRHILLLNFLGDSVKSNVSMNFSINPFGKGPWPCLNAAAPHFLENVVTDCKITKNYKLDVPVGRFTCSCGFVFSRRGPDTKEEDRQRIGRIKEFGHVWEDKLMYLKNVEGKSMHSISKLFHIDSNTVRRQLKRLEKEGQNFVDRAENKQQKMRSVWGELVLSNPAKNKTELRKMSPNTFAWLYRYDRDWLDENSPTLTRNNNRVFQKSRIDWNSRDQMLSEKAQEAIIGELSEKKRPTRLTARYIGQMIGEMALLQYRLDKLPLTKQIVKGAVESYEEYHIRRVKYTAQEINERNEQVVAWKVIRESGIGSNLSERVKRQIEIEVEKYSNLLM
ncbi:TnsD family transposase [Brevibacillus centrosporus]|uniref:TnsD family transposase n=1 Tax=Brevibacillus centrosporus TaxID=54910 RepID=UPI003B0257C4